MDARHVLGVAENASAEEIRAAYLTRVKEHPPDRSPEQFERIRDAYEILKDPRKRAREMLVAADAWAPLIQLLEPHETERRYVGPGPWLEALKGK